MVRAFPKPLPRSKPNDSRLSWRKAVTVVAGFRFKRGVVLCADTQETVGDIYKRHVPKLRFEESPRAYASLGGSDLAVAFCGATNKGSFVDKLVDRAWIAARNESDIDAVCEAIEKSIEETYRHYGGIYQAGYMPDAELIYGVKMGGQSRLFSANGPESNQQQQYCTGGVGSYLADFLVARMYTEGLTVQQCVILAAYVLFQTKEHVDGCGGKSHIAVLGEDGPSGQVDAQRIEAITKNLEQADLELGPLLLASCDLDIGEEEFKVQADNVYTFLKSHRDKQKEDFEEWERFRRILDSLLGGLKVKRDSFGFTQSIDETGEPGQ